jgi:D-alanine-D-alanine ligase
MPTKMKVALLFGGRSAEHDVSLLSAASIYKNLDKTKYATACIYIDKKGFWKPVDSPLVSRPNLDKSPIFSFLPWENEGLASRIDADIYFPVLHGPYGEDGTIQGLFEMAGVPFVGAAVLASAAGMDKAIAKCLFQNRELPLVKHLVIREPDWDENSSAILARIQKEFPFPYFVKPGNLGSSVGISKVHSREEAEPAIRKAFQFDVKVLVEQAIQGREIECSVLGHRHPQASLPGEVIPHREFYDYRDKYIDGLTTFKIPVDLPKKTIATIQSIAIEAFQAIDCSGMARVDFFLQQNSEKVFLNEINTIPGFTEISMYPKLWEVSGIPYPELLDRLIDFGLEKHKDKKSKGASLKP